MSLSKAERATTINYDEEGENAEVVTYSRALITSLEKNEGAVLVERLSEGGVIYRIPKKLVNVRNPRKGAGMSQEARDAARDRLAAARAGKQ